MDRVYELVGDGKIACVPCWNEFEEGRMKIKDELEETRLRLMKQLVDEWQKSFGNVRR